MLILRPLGLALLYLSGRRTASPVAEPAHEVDHDPVETARHLLVSTQTASSRLDTRIIITLTVQLTLLTYIAGYSAYGAGGLGLRDEGRLLRTVIACAPLSLAACLSAGALLTFRLTSSKLFVRFSLFRFKYQVKPRTLADVATLRSWNPDRLADEILRVDMLTLYTHEIVWASRILHQSTNLFKNSLLLTYLAIPLEYIMFGPNLIFQGYG